MTELLKQPKEQILKLSEQVALLTLFHLDLLSNIPVKEVSLFEEKLLRFLNDDHHAVMDSIDNTKKLTPDLRQQLEDAVRDFASIYGV